MQTEFKAYLQDINNKTEAEKRHAAFTVSLQGWDQRD